ncbi:MAG: putative lipid II flippase FtsW [Clostridiales Family XIII bacterium]|jgi:cell division protein FtsW|nr:putative lipid II flippase FtsW [Clostridiales Family XIII bacterium]
MRERLKTVTARREAGERTARALLAERRTRRREAPVERYGRVTEPVLRTQLREGGPAAMVRAKAGDFLFAFLILCLVAFGILMVFSASNYVALNEMGDSYYYLKRVAAWAVVGFAVMLAAALVPYSFYRKLSPVFLIVTVAMLFAVLSPLGIVRNNASRWLGLGENLTVMPGEIAKVAAILFVAWYVSQDAKRIRSLKGVAFLLVVAAALFILIYRQPSLSTAITVFCIVLGMMFVAGLKWRHALMIAVAGALMFFCLLSRSADADGYQWGRITSFLNPFEDPQNTGYQVIQSLLALGAGGFRGVGFGKSIQKTLYLPEGHNDFIFAIIGEELGLIGCLLLIAAYLLLIYKSVQIAIRAKDQFGMLVAAGFSIMIAIQVIMNIAVVTSSMPATGVSLPFVSYGGNALVVYMGLAGIVWNISRYRYNADA